ncbi:MAG: CrcB family protein [Thalassobaculales bacterium]
MHARWQAAREVAALYALVALGSTIGGVLRAAVGMAAVATLGPTLPWGTLIVNVVGSFAIGYFATLTGPGGRLFVSARSRHFVMTGICGGFTTFSVFSLETFRLAAAGQLAAAGLNVAGSVVTWLGAVWLGHLAASRSNRLGGS